MCNSRQITTPHRNNENRIQKISKGVVFALIFCLVITSSIGQPIATSNYNSQTGSLGSTYSWIDCSSGTSIVSGDDAQSSINWPFDFTFYGNTYTTANSLSVAVNGFIRLDGVADGGNYNASNSYDLTSTATNFGQIISLAMYDDYVGRVATSWVKYLVTGSAPYRILTIEYSDLSIPYYSTTEFADIQVSFYETTNKVVLKYGNDNVTTSGVDMGIHSGVSGYFNKWQEVASGTNNTWIEYSLPIQVESTAGTAIAYYQNLKTAFDNINSGKHQGEITIKINGNTIETATALLNASGSGSANYTSVNVFPTQTGLSVSGNISKLISFVGADNVTIDGRVNATGTDIDLKIINTSTSNTAGTSTLFFVDDASNNTIKYCNIQGSETAASSAIIVLSTAIADGNNNNVISNNKITSSTDANRPVNALTSSGTSGKENKNNTVSNNEFYNVLSRSATSSAILIGANSTLWTITGNSFYETTAFASNGSYTYYAIKISNNLGSGFLVNDNYIGGTAPLCGGTAWTKTNTKSNPFYGIYLDLGTDVASSIQNNTIQNFNWANSANASWSGINLAAGSANIGTITGNTIGNSTGNGSITVTAATTGMNFYGINLAGTGIISCKNNTIGAITVANSGATLASSFIGINSTSTGTVEISQNTIGSATQANSINATSASTSYAQSVFGIKNTGAASLTINNNTIANLTNQNTNTSTSSLGLVNGITTSAGTSSIKNNTISYLSNSNANSASSSSASVTGIALSPANTQNTVSGNTISNLSNSFSPFIGNVIGIYFGASGSTQVVSENFIHDLTVTGATTTGSYIYGIKMNAGNTTYSNNIISLGGNNASTIYGIYGYGLASNNYNVYFNSVYIYGSLSSGITTRSYAFYGNSTANIRDIRNNIFMNARNTTGGANLHFAAYFNFASNTNLTLDYNDYYVSGTGSTLGFYSSANKTALPIVDAKDANSLNIDPLFANGSGTTASDYSSNATLPGVAGTGIATDYFDVTRSSTPKIGAIESALSVWQGATSDDFGTASNWTGGQVPLDGSEIRFADTPNNDCVMDINRTIRTITNAQNAKKFVLNGKQLTLTGSLAFSNGAQIDATSTDSKIIFAGTTAQNIPSGSFVSNTIDKLTVNNTLGLTLNGDITIPSELTLTAGTFTLGANTITLNGSITQTAGTLTGGATTNIVVGGSGASINMPSINLNNLTLNRSNGMALVGNIAVGGTLTLTAGTLTIGANTLTISGNTPVRTSGNIDASNAEATLEFNNTSAISLPASIFSGAIQNLTISGAGGVTSTQNMTVNGILDLQIANPSSTKGGLDMTSSSELTMGANGNNIGIGDVTGIIARYSFVENSTYTFGNPNSYALFNPGATTLPTYLKLKVDIGTAPAWRTGAINRVYELIQSGGDNSIGSFRCHYLDSELNGNAEDKLSLWTPWDNVGNPPNLDNGRSNYSVSDNWVELTDVLIFYFPPAFGMFPITLDETELTFNRWTGLVSTDWNNGANWSPQTVPTAVSYVLIPDATTTPNDPTLPANANTQIMSLSLESGSILNSGSTDNAQLSLTHNLGTWSNNGGTFNPGNSTVNFIRNGNSTISGTTSFYNLHLADTVILTMNGGAHIKVSGALTIGETGPLRGVLRTVVSGTTTVEYNGGDQTVVIPHNATNRYSNLILSGTGTKTMPSANLHIYKDFFLKGTTTTTAASSLTIDGELEIYAGATFNTGNFDHSIKEAFDNAGTFNAAAGTTITLNGDSSQKIYGATPTTFEKLTIDNNYGVVIHTNTTLNNTLELTSGHLHIGNTLLTVNGNITKTAGFLTSTAQSSITFGGTTGLTLSSSMFDVNPTFNNMTINRTGGVVFQRELTVNGVLTLQSANPSATAGTLDMESNTLNMGATATTVGIGDVTGIIKRTEFSPNIAYSFGNQYTTITFPNSGIMPTFWGVKVSIGTAPSWKTVAVLRKYEFIESGGSDMNPIVRMHYLDSELNGNAESDLAFWGSCPSTSEYGKLNQDNTDNWISLSESIDHASQNFGECEWTISSKEALDFTWKGTTAGQETNWNEPFNWTGGSVPVSTSDVIIPAGCPNYPTLPTTASINTISIANNAIVNGGTATTLTINGAIGAWLNRGTLNPGTSKIIFTNSDAYISGTTNFYDIEIGSGAKATLTTDNIMRIAGTITINGTLDATLLPNTVEYNGVGAQNICNPNGITVGYYNLILSESGIKTLPATSLSITNNFSTSGTVTATASATINLVKDATIGTGTTFETGNYDHTIGGNLTNNGTITAASGTSIVFNGSTAQSISGSTTSNFEILNINNSEGVTLNSSANVSNNLSLSNGSLIVGSSTLGINGTISNPAGNINVTTNSNLSFGGTTALTLNSNLFSSTPSINNLTINRSGGVSLNDQSMTVNGTLTLTSGTFAIGANTFTIAGNSPVRTSGTVDASDASATIAFANSAAITLPSSFFTGNVNNMTISANGGVTVNNDLAMVGILNLSGSNPSATKGSLDMGSSSILNMGENSTTIGIGDVTGIVKRNHTFLNDAEYSFGNKFTTMKFIGVDGSTKPTWVSCKIEIGAAPVWRSVAVKRTYSFLQSGGNDRTYVKLHYLDSELDPTETIKSRIIMYTDKDGLITGDNTVPVGKTNNDTINNWVELLGMAIDQIALSSTTYAKQYGLGYTNVSRITWTGLGSASYPGDWSLPGNWLGGVPTAEDDALIPSGLGTPYPYRNLLTTLTPSHVKSIEIEAGATVDATNYEITVYGEGNAWVNNGTFTPGNSTVIFANGDIDKTVNLSGTTEFNNLTINDKTNIVPLLNTAISINGNLICDGNYISTNENTLVINGTTSDQTISGNGTMNLSNFTMNNTFSNGKLTLEMPISIAKTLTLTNNHIFTDTVNYIEIKSTATVSPDGGSATSYVDGPIRKIGNTAFVFPVGNNNQYAPLTISAADGGGNATDYFTAYYLNVSPSGAYDSTQVEAPITRVSGMEYWMLNRSGTNNVFVTLGWDSRSGGVTSLSDLTIAHWDGTKWTDAGNSATTGDTASGTITSNLATSFSPFTLATTKKSWYINPLPIELISFDAKLVNGQTLLNWVTASEINNDYFTVERTKDGANFELIGIVDGAGNSNQVLSYSSLDKSPLTGISYYRLKQTDFDGTSTYSRLVAIENHILKSAIYPNPSKGIFTIETATENSILMVFNVVGKKLLEQKLDTNKSTLDLSQLADGVYYFKIISATETTTKSVTIAK